MAMAVAPQHRESSSSGSLDKHLTDNGKYVRYTSEQVEALERVYAECPKPSSLRRQQLIRECPILANIEPKQIKVWFQNRRCREKQRKESSRLQTVNRKLTAMNKLLMEENDRLQKQVSQLVCENGFMQQQLQTAPAAADASCDSAVTTPGFNPRSFFISQTSPPNQNFSDSFPLKFLHPSSQNLLWLRPNNPFSVCGWQGHHQLVTPPQLLLKTGDMENGVDFKLHR